MTQVKQIFNKEMWEKFVREQPYTLFVQSWKYGEFYSSIGEQFWIWGIYDEDKLRGGSLLVSVHAKRGNFLYAPYGPLISPELSEPDRDQALQVFFAHLKKFAKENKYDFIRVSPFFKNTDKINAAFRANGLRPAPMHILAEYTWILNLEPSEEELLKNMEKNHRNLIKRCERAGVRIEISRGEEAVASFNRLHDVTAARHNFHRFTNDYVQKEFSVFALDNEAVSLLAYLPDGTLDSAGIFIYYGTMGVYRHGASLISDKKIATSYLLQWEAIREAKRRGLRWYNFWGITPDKAPEGHPFKGITHFKKGFGGFPRQLLPCHDLPVSWRYWINWIVETFRSLNRGFK